MITIRMGPGPEFDRIRAFAEVIADVLGPIGEDTAPVPDGKGQLVVSTDATVENVHFRRNWISMEELGWRATAAALSDLSAVGAWTAGVTVAVVIPPDAAPHHLTELMKGVAAALRSTRGFLLGGDLSAGPCWMVTVTVLGHVEHPIGRRGARPGDRLWVTGMLGGSRAALESWNEGLEPPPPARLAFARPKIRLAAGRWLASHGATAMIDLSDGLGGDAAHLAAASGVGLVITLSSVPVNPAALEVARRREQSSSTFAAGGGEDYELLVTMPPEWNNVADFEAETGTRLSAIGEVTHSPGVRFSLHDRDVTIKGFSHLI